MTTKPNYMIDDLKTSQFREDLGEDLELYNKVVARHKNRD